MTRARSLTIEHRPDGLWNADLRRAERNGSRSRGMGGATFLELLAFLLTPNRLVRAHVRLCRRPRYRRLFYP